MTVWNRTQGFQCRPQTDRRTVDGHENSQPDGNSTLYFQPRLEYIGQPNTLPSSATTKLLRRDHHPRTINPTAPYPPQFFPFPLRRTRRAVTNKQAGLPLSAVGENLSLDNHHPKLPLRHSRMKSTDISSALPPTNRLRLAYLFSGCSYFRRSLCSQHSILPSKDFPSRAVH